MCCMTGKSFAIYGNISAQYVFTRASHAHRLLGWPRIIQHTSGESVLAYSCGHTRLCHTSSQTAIRNGLLVRCASGYRRSCEPAKNDNCTGRCHGSVFEQHNPSRNQPRTTKRAQMPNVESWNDAHCPDDERHRRGRPYERQQPEQVPWIYHWRTQKRCSHGPCKCVR